MAAKKSKPPILTLTPEQESEANHKIKRFMEDRFELDLGSFEAAEILELFAREIAPHYYNRAIFDVQAHLKERFESIESDLWALEKN
ncbi:1-(5-phosphoribosyl)-5-((5-phosphoribosylamino)methylideneamino)imidazole-4-carboxamide isomerase [Pseudomonas chlororaphis]|nr:1-(5-phosphoribosyl)-5-((5-phosphoribosylamino)methylideneamino)imidazole-4-carboxamide isomerase [Pseudomonas chlororaphis]